MFRSINKRRKLLTEHFDIRQEFNAIEESCIPSYIHRNYLAALVAWMRLSAAAKLYHRHGPAGDILDFGASSGELFHLLNLRGPYHFIETNEILVEALTKWVPAAQRQKIDNLEAERYEVIFALDVLEHITDIEKVLDQLCRSLRPSGIMILSGPTENFLYRIGRKISGFEGHYHTTNIYDIERIVSLKLNSLASKKVPWGLPLFRVSVWVIK